MSVSRGMSVSTGTAAAMRDGDRQFYGRRHGKKLRQNRAELLFIDKAHAVLGIGDDGGGVEIAGSAGGCAAGENACA